MNLIAAARRILGIPPTAEQLALLSPEGGLARRDVEWFGSLNDPRLVSLFGGRTTSSGASP